MEYVRKCYRRYSWGIRTGSRCRDLLKTYSKGGGRCQPRQPGGRVEHDAFRLEKKVSSATSATSAHGRNADKRLHSRSVCRRSLFDHGQTPVADNDRLQAARDMGAEAATASPHRFLMREKSKSYCRFTNVLLTRLFIRPPLIRLRKLEIRPRHVSSSGRLSMKCSTDSASASAQSIL